MLVVALLAVGGCARTVTILHGLAPTLVPDPRDAAQRAAELPYASIAFTVEGRGGLLVLAELAYGNAYFQSAARDVIVTRNGYLDQAVTPYNALLMTRVTQQDGGLHSPPWQLAELRAPFEYRVQRLWRSADGALHADRAQATLVCGGTENRQLPLVSMPLQRCRETLVWSGGRSTHSTFWRDPKNHRLWAVRTVPWPGAPEFAWEVARPWW